jgi:hypothetical protein
MTRMRLALVAALLGMVVLRAQTPLGTAFVYQGRLTDGGAPATGVYDFRVQLFDAATDGTLVGTPPTVFREDVAVAAGSFALSLDFGAAAFGASKRWLEIGVRPGVSTADFTVLQPRQEVAPTPTAIYATSAGSATIAATATTAQTAQAVAPGAITGSMIAAGAVGAAQIDPAQVQARVTGGCAAGQYVRSVAPDGTVVCGADVDTNSGGTVRGVTAGSGLAATSPGGGSTIITTGTLAIAPGGVSSAMIAPGAIGATQVNQAQVQTRISGTCPVGQYFRGVAADGTVICEPVPGVPAITAVGPGGTASSRTSIAIGQDGLPVISFHDSKAGALKVAKCVNAACTGTAVVTPVDDPAGKNVGEYSSIAVGTDGFPVISYYNSTDRALMVAKCSNPSCLPAPKITPVDGALVGEYTSIAIGTDGLPVISYYDAAAQALKVAKCADVACTATIARTRVDDSASDVGINSSIAIGRDGFPVVSYYDAAAQALKVAKCVDAACAVPAIIRTLDNPSNAVGYFSATAIGADGYPVVAYTDWTAQGLKVAKCGDAACSGTPAVTPVDTAGGFFPSIAIGADGLPVISYQGSHLGLKVAKCVHASCVGTSTITTVDAASEAGDTSITIGADGLPAISYRDVSSGNVKVAKCGTRTCQ